ncbi:hypothetical protein [uncultured Kordia sp.]|uniref:hypothetical protein n=1 Tax=uncultured Kordia sp. TaxID=507699 RepID=UPI002609A18E|nr:hypothetical protein [uncultured Kordia sp.]
MGIFSKLFGKNRDNSEHKNTQNAEQTEETTQEVPQKLNIDISQTPEKFQHVADELVPFLTTILHELHILEKEIFERSQALKNPNEPNQVQPGEMELWTEFAERRKAITDPVSLKPSDNGSRSFGKPTKYEYIHNPDTTIVFIMKSAKRAVIEAYYERGVSSKNQFVLRKEEDTWKVDSKKYGFQGETTWYKDEF